MMTLHLFPALCFIFSLNINSFQAYPAVENYGEERLLTRPRGPFNPDGREFHSVVVVPKQHVLQFPQAERTYLDYTTPDTFGKSIIVLSVIFIVMCLILLQNYCQQRNFALTHGVNVINDSKILSGSLDKKSINKFDNGMNVQDEIPDFLNQPLITDDDDDDKLITKEKNLLESFLALFNEEKLNEWKEYFMDLFNQNSSSENIKEKILSLFDYENLQNKMNEITKYQPMLNETKDRVMQLIQQFFGNMRPAPRQQFQQQMSPTQQFAQQEQAPKKLENKMVTDDDDDEYDELEVPESSKYRLSDAENARELKNQFLKNNMQHHIRRSLVLQNYKVSPEDFSQRENTITPTNEEKYSFNNDNVNINSALNTTKKYDTTNNAQVAFDKTIVINQNVIVSHLPSSVSHDLINTSSPCLSTITTTMMETDSKSDLKLRSRSHSHSKRVPKSNDSSPRSSSKSRSKSAVNQAKLLPPKAHRHHHHHHRHHQQEGEPGKETQSRPKLSSKSKVKKSKKDHDHVEKREE